MDTTSLPTALSTKELSIGYSKKPLLANIQLSFNKGELIGIFGVNGSGKSTLLKTLSREISPVKGQILIHGKNSASFSAKEFAKELSIVLTHPSFSENLTVKELVSLGRFPHNNWLGILSEKDKSNINDALFQMNISALSHRKCAELSDGQLQKAFIARALAQNTDIILLDEPTNHLDLQFKVQVFNLLKQIANQQNKVILMATHELNMALQICDKIILLHDGKIFNDTPENLIRGKHLEKLFPSDRVMFKEEAKIFQFQFKGFEDSK